MHEVPENLSYTKTHEWVKQEGNICIVGITDYAQSQLTDIVYVDLPKVGKKLKKGEVLLTVESVKSAEDVFSPVDGEVVEINKDLEDKPEVLNQKPYESWMAKIKTSGGILSLMKPEEYKKFIGE
ncbi:MAG: glycine cleavage system protein GcvH [Candidatus Thermoplasmatota archaeon]|jgi:glycine cleavage system H protein|nr:glycine cleavage system protein GcvH [Candidatus Thermoplasmatota archaeon]